MDFSFASSMPSMAAYNTSKWYFYDINSIYYLRFFTSNYKTLARVGFENKATT